MSQQDYLSSVAIPSHNQGHFQDMTAEEVLIDIYPQNFAIRLQVHSKQKMDNLKQMDLTDSQISKPKRASRRERLKNRLLRGSSSSMNSEVFAQEWNLQDACTAQFTRGHCWRELALDPQICSALEQSVIAATRIGKYLNDNVTLNAQNSTNSSLNSESSFPQVSHLQCVIKPGLIRFIGHIKSIESTPRFSTKSLFTKNSSSAQSLIQIDYQWDDCAQLQQPQATVGELEIFSNELLTELTQACQGRLGLIARLLGPKKSQPPIPERFANLLWA